MGGYLVSSSPQLAPSRSVASHSTTGAVGISHGQTTGVRAGLPVTGTYYVNPDCTGGQTTNIPGVPPLEDSFVIVDNGREVRTVVILPTTTIATANLRKK